MRDPAPFWVSLSASAIRALPFGRYHLANALGAFRGPALPGPPAAGSRQRELCLRPSRHDRARSVFHGPLRAAGDAARQRLLGPGMVVVDVGANWGYFTLVCAHLVGSSGRVMALEPHPRLASMLAENVTANGSVAGRSPSSRGWRRPAGRRRLSASTNATATGACRAPRTDGSRRTSRPEVVALDAIARRRQAWPHRSREDRYRGREAGAIRGMAAGLARHRYR